MVKVYRVLFLLPFWEVSIWTLYGLGWWGYRLRTREWSQLKCDVVMRCICDYMYWLED